MAKFKKNHRFSGSKLARKNDTWAETAKYGLKCFKMHSNTYSPKRDNKMKTNGKKWQQMSENYK